MSQQLPLWPDEPRVIPDDEIRVAAYGRVRIVECRECRFWFLGCLRGREQWHDEAITPNMRYKPHMRCDGFEWDENERRMGRAVVPDEDCEVCGWPLGWVNGKGSDTCLNPNCETRTG